MFADLPNNIETGNQKYSPNKLCSITVRAILGRVGGLGVVTWVKVVKIYYYTGVLWGGNNNKVQCTGKFCY